MFAAAAFHRRARVSVTRCLIAVVAFFGLTVAAHAATVRPGAILEEHHHNTGGHDWHVQLEVDTTGTRLASVVAYSMECDETGFVKNVKLAADGSFDIDLPLLDRKGRFAVRGTFIDRDRANGTWQITKGACTFGGEFHAQDSTGHFVLGNPFEYAPKRITGGSPNALRVRRLRNQTYRNASRFATIDQAAAQGYVLSTRLGCPGFHHARKNSASLSGSKLDPTAPQALVYWCDAETHWTLAAFMYRAISSSRPNTYSDLIQWHKHGPQATWMMHVWTVFDPIAAFATCAPFRSFAAEGRFRYSPYVVDSHIDEPCSDSPPPVPPATVVAPAPPAEQVAPVTELPPPPPA